MTDFRGRPRPPRFSSDHWIQAAYDRITAGEDAELVLWEFGYIVAADHVLRDRKPPSLRPCARCGQPFVVGGSMKTSRGWTSKHCNSCKTST